MRQKRHFRQKIRFAFSYFLRVLAYAVAIGVLLIFVFMWAFGSIFGSPKSTTDSVVIFIFMTIFAILFAVIAGIVMHQDFSDRQKKQRKQKEIAGNNPYIVGAPVPPDRFYGREELIGAILTAIKTGNHIAIYGERRIGKTSLLHQLAHRLTAQSDIFFIPVFIQMQMLAEDNFFGVLIDTVIKSIPTSAKKSLPSLIRQRASQPYDVLGLAADLETIIETLTGKNKKPLRLVFLLDEGDRLNEFSESTQMKLRGLLQTPLMNKHVQLVWSGARIDQVWKSDTSPWFNLFKADFHLGSLKPEAARNLITQPVNNLYDYEDAAISKILALTNRKPYPIQQVCSACIASLEAEQRHITVQDVERAWTKQKQDNQSKPSLTYQTASPQTQIAEAQTPYNPDGDNI